MLCRYLNLFLVFLSAVLLHASLYREVIYGTVSARDVDVFSFDTANTTTLLSDRPSQRCFFSQFTVRPDTGEFYGVGTSGINILDPNTGSTTLVAPPPVPLNNFFITGASFQPGTANLFLTNL